MHGTYSTHYLLPPNYLTLHALLHGGVGKLAPDEPARSMCMYAHAELQRKPLATPLLTTALLNTALLTTPLLTTALYCGAADYSSTCYGPADCGGAHRLESYTVFSGLRAACMT